MGHRVYLSKPAYFNEPGCQETLGQVPGRKLSALIFYYSVFKWFLDTPASLDHTQ